VLPRYDGTVDKCVVYSGDDIPSTRLGGATDVDGLTSCNRELTFGKTIVAVGVPQSDLHGEDAGGPSG
jgi:hypothetical protein